MANITIREIDNTSAGTIASTTDIVYIPGFVTSDETKYDRSTLAEPFEPMLCSSISDFEAYFGFVPAEFDDSQSYPEEFKRDNDDTEGRWALPAAGTYMFDKKSQDPSYIIAKELINAGISVLYERINGWDTGEDGITVVASPEVKAMYNALSGKTDVKYHDIFENLKDKGEYSVKYITSGGYPTFEYKSISYSAEVEKHFVNNDRVSVFSDMRALWYKTNKYENTLSDGYKFSYESPTNESFDTGEYSWYRYAGTLDKDTMEWTWTLVKHDEDSGDTPTENKEEAKVVLADYGINISGPISKGRKVGETTDTVEFDNCIVEPIQNDAGSIIVSRMIDCAYTRGDAVAFIDHTNNAKRAVNPVSTESVYWAISNPQSNFMVNGAGAEFATMFTPWCTYNCVKNGTSEMLPGSYAYLLSLAKSLKTNPSWYAIAGASRGIISNFVAPHTEKRVTNAIADAYQPRDAVSINPITNIKPYGYTIWGNRTLKNNGVEGNLTATSFLNIRNLVSEVKKIAYTAAKRCMFEQNSDVLWIKFKALIMPTLDKMISSYGLSNYKILKIETTEKAKLVCHIKLYPIYAVEDFDITVFMEDEEISIS